MGTGYLGGMGYPGRNGLYRWERDTQEGIDYLDRMVVVLLGVSPFVACAE